MTPHTIGAISSEQENEVLQVYNTYWDYYLSGDTAGFASMIHEEAQLFGSTESEAFFDKKAAVTFYKATSNQISGKTEFRNRRISLMPFESSILVIEQLDLFVLIDDSWTFYNHARLSTVFSHIEGNWKIIHQHGSFPDAKTGEGEQLAIQNIKTENIRLKEAVKRRTVELEYKNRELEIEASLERVRTVAMGMKKPGDVLNVCEAMFKELQLLGFNELRNAIIHTFVDEQKHFYDHDYSDFKGGAITLTPYSGHPVVEKFIKEIRQTKDAFTEITVTGKELEDWKAFRIVNGQTDDPRLDNISTLFYYAYSIGPASIGISTFKSISEEQREVLKRFRNVFDFAYRRYMDVAQAEEQAMEAKIEAALEKVRSSSLAMHSSDELGSVITVVLKNLQQLGFVIDNGAAAHLAIFSKGTRDIVQWSADSVLLNTPVRVRIPYTDLPIFNDFFEVKNKGGDFFSKVYDFKEKNEWFAYAFEHSDLKNLPDDLKQMLLASENYAHWMAIEENSALIVNSISGNKLSQRQIDILKRFSKVFEQAYIRFLDLQKAEAQAREAVIEVSLERVRSRAMSMQHSEEIGTLIGTIFAELTRLDLVLTRCVIWIFDKETSGARWWMANGEDPSRPMSFFIPNHDAKPYQGFLKAWKQKQATYVFDLNGETKKDWDDFLFNRTELSQLPAFIIEGMKAPDRVLLSASFNVFSAINVASLEPLSNEHFDILVRFARVFEMGYTRFYDLKQAESQAREAQVELALERVRASTMAMQKSGELAETASLLFKQISDLGIQTWTSGFNIWEKNESSFIGYNPTPSGGITAPYYIPATEDNFFKTIYEAKKTGEDFFVFESEGKSLANTYDYMKTLPVVKDVLREIEESGFQLPNFQINHCSFFSYGFLLFITLEAATHAHDIFKRFGKVFEQTYTRFLDLKKAEAQAREAQIETALERVRSRSMAMHKSEELEDVIQVVFEQFIHLNILIEHTGFIIDYKERDDMQIWLADKLSSPFQVTIPYFDSPHWNSFIEAKEKGKHFFTNQLNFEEKNKFYKDLFELIPGLPEESKEVILSKPGLAISTVLLENVGLYIENFSGIPYTDEENATLMRFGKVFQQTYTRFLDLQKAEAQVREAQIEAALERTRTQSMIMQHSKELDDTLRVFHEQVLLLGIKSAFSYLWLPDKEKDRHIFWAAWAEELPSIQAGQKGSSVFRSKASDFPLDRNEPATAQCLVDWESKEPVFTYHVPPDGVDNYFAAWQELFGGVEQLKPEYFSDGLYYVEAFMKYGCFGVMIENEMHEDEKKILVRFAIEFERTYTRFLDLQKAEAQARDAQVEASLERVRSKAMAMQKSDDLAPAVTIVFEELDKLNPGTLRCGIGIIDKIKKSGNIWTTVKSDKGTIAQVSGDESMDLHPLLQNAFEAWRKQEDYDYELSGDDLTKFYKATEGTFELPDSQSGQANSQVVSQYYHLASFQAGGLYAFRDTPFTEEAKLVMKRFADVFNLTYTRFLELQKAEAQVREAQIEAGLERVRASTMAMHNSEDVSSAIATLFTELDRLGIENMRCGIATINKDKTMEVWSVTNVNDGKSVKAAGKFDINAHKLWRLFYDSWQKKSMFYHYYLAGQEKQDYIDILNNTPNYLSQPILDMPDMHFQSYHFNEGGIWTFSVQPHTEENRQVMHRFSAVFSQTFRRYQDLQKAEAQTRESQIELGLERVRARAMAMQKSDELKELIGTVFTELTKLDLALTRCLIWIIDKGTSSAHLYLANSETPLQPVHLFIQYHAYAPYLAILKAWNEKNQRWVYDCHGQNKKTWDDYVFEKTDFSLLPELVKERMKSADRVILSASFNNFGGLQTAGSEHLSDEHMDILYRFAKVFDLTYTRFNDIQKAEAQAREAKIEASLERVRSRTMAMHKTDELLDAAELISKELTGLGIESMNVSYAFLDHEKKSASYYSLNPVDGKIPPFPFIFPHHETNVMRSILSSWEKQEPFYLLELDEEATLKHQTWVGEHILNLIITKNIDIPFSIESFLAVSPKKAVIYTFNFSHGYLFKIGATRMSNEEEELVLRFTRVFEMTYRRFLDLQNAEAQTRESQIQLAMERVRARTMAMQKSDELPEAANLLFQQVQSLGMPAWSAGYCVWEDDKNAITLWMSSEGVLQPAFKLPLTEDPSLMHFREAHERGESFFVEEVGGEELRSHYAYMRTLPGVKETLDDIEKAGFPVPTFQIFHLAYFSKGFLLFITYAPVPESHDIFKRFGKVFDQTYTRFLDLEKAEAQAREAKIETALEKVRSRSLAMHSSDELGDVITVVLKNLYDLGFIMDNGAAAHLMLFSKNSRDFVQWSADAFLEAPVRSRIPYADIGILADMFDAKDSGANFFTKVYDFDQKNTFFTFAFEHSDLKLLPQELKQLILQSESYVHWVAIEENSAITVNSITGNQLSENQIDILKRFARVFEQAYIRFLDLKKAEAQAKEAQIESALEKVRSRSLAMHRSEELQEVVTTVFERLKELDIQTDAINLDVFSENKKDAYLWTAVPGQLYSKAIHIPYTEIAIFKDIYDGMISGKLLHSKVYSRELKDDFLNYIFEHTDFREIPQERKDLLFAADGSSVSVAFAKNTAIIAQRYANRPFSNDENEILIRFANVFEQCYTRFKDLEKAEAQTREAMIEAALERVRSKAMAMHSSKDLSDTIVAFYHELEEFSITPRRCGVGLINRETRIAELSTMNTTDQRTSVEIVGTLKMEGHPVLEGVYDHWMEQKEYYPILKGAEIPAYYKLIKPQIAFPDYPNDAVQYGYFFFFPEGGVYAWTEKIMAEDELVIYRRFTSVLSLTYKRYKDLQHAEELAKQAEEDLVILKVEKKKTEEALSELKTTQSQLVQSEKMASLGELTAGIAHEIQNPLNFVNNFSEVSTELLDEMLEEVDKGNFDDVKAIVDDLKQNLEKINHHGKRADGIVKGMLQHSRSSSGQKEPTDINVLADEYLRLAFHGLRAKDKSFNATFKTDFDSSIGKVDIIPQDIGRVLVNLLNNAFYAVNEKRKKEARNYEPTVTVCTFKAAEAIEIRVTDNGNGIPKDALDKIFQPFFTTKPTGQGTGLGLSLSYDIIKAHGGELKAETKEGEGSTFIICIPG